MKKFLLSFILVLIMIMTVACGEAGSSQKAKSYTWNGVSFTVKSITAGAQTDDGAGKQITVTIDFGKGEMSQKVFESNVTKGMFTLNGVKPEGQYLYHIGKSVFGANGFEGTITGEAVMYFSMDADYELNESDLVIKE